MAAAGVAAMMGGIGASWAQGAQRIERLVPALDRIISNSQPIQE